MEQSVVRVKQMDVVGGTSLHVKLARRWYDMHKRAYSEKWHKTRPRYIGTEVCDEWFIFSNFKKWAEQFDYENLHLDKDLLGCGFLYSPETCCFIPQEINNFLTKSKHNGITTHKKVTGYRMQFHRPEGCVSQVFGTETEARNAYKALKLERAAELYNKYKGSFEHADKIVNWVERNF